jgi:hypothetical protein
VTKQQLPSGEARGSGRGNDPGNGMAVTRHQEALVALLDRIEEL